MIITGIADEAAPDLPTQIKAHQELGWDHIELRLIDGKNVAGELEDDAFEDAVSRLKAAGMQITAFASGIANWSRNIKDDFQADTDDLERSIPRMHRLGVKYIRVMSWVGEGASDPEWRDEAVRRLKILSRMAEDGGIYLCHENCTGWGGLSAMHMREIQERVDSPAFLLLYDLGNTISHGQDPWEFFSEIRHQFSYLHVKDGIRKKEGEPSSEHAYCGEGDAMIPQILSTVILEDGYDGVISIEPHVASIVHLGSEEKADPEKMYSSYITYGRKLQKILSQIVPKGDR